MNAPELGMLKMDFWSKDAHWLKRPSEIGKEISELISPRFNR